MAFQENRIVDGQVSDNVSECEKEAMKKWRINKIITGE